MKIKKIFSKEQGLSGELNYAHFVDEGVIINKDGAFLVSFTFRGIDINSANDAELDALAENFNRMVTMLGDGWMLHIDELRIPSITYPESGYFPDTVSALIDEERRQKYEAEKIDGAHYENIQFLTFVWKFPLPIVKVARHWFVEGIEKNKSTDKSQDLSKLLKQFYEVVERCIGLLSSQLILEKLNSADILSYLNTCITGDLLPVAVPREGCYLDVVLGRKNVSGGYVPKIGNKNIYVLSILGYLNDKTMPGLLEHMSTYPLIYRWSNRFIPFSEKTAEREIKRYQKNWNNKVKGLAGILRETITGTQTDKIDIDALQMSQQTQLALTLNSNQSTRFGIWTSEIVLINENIEILDQAVKDISRYVEQSGFSCQKEDVNAFDAWLGTVPGNGSRNIRQMFIDSMNLAHVLPLHTVWAGATHSPKASLLPQNSPPVCYASTTGRTPYRFHLDVQDVGHQTVLGPTGSGKTTYEGFVISQFFRYKNAKCFIFDKDFSHRGLTAALDGCHYDIGNADELSFCPLADLSTENKKMRAEQYIENLVYLQQVPILPDIRFAIHKAIDSLAKSTQPDSRNLTVFKSIVQHEAVRSAIQFYTIEGQIKLLDGTKDSMRAGNLHTFEMNWLLNQKPEIYIPVLDHIFNHIESCLDDWNGLNPTLIVLSEAWIYITHPVFAKKIKDYLKTLRKKNARVIISTQSVADLYDPSTKTLTATTAAIIESCPTRIYLPNPSIDSEMYVLYQKLGLSERQIEIISKEAVPKRNYYIVTPEGNRLIDLGFDGEDSMPLSFIGLSKEKANALIDCKKKYGNEWVSEWLLENNFSKWAEYSRINNLKSRVA
jgi:type IV secretion/conjugal transfer VirB4 family ATPase